MLTIRRVFWGSAVIWSAVTAAAQEGPFAPDAETSLLLHLDGDAGDASGAENHGRVRGPVIGQIAPWYLGKDGYRGSIDEVRVSATVRPAYAIAVDSPPRTAPAWDNRTVPALDPTRSGARLDLQPETTRIVLPALHPAQGNFQTAEELQQWLRKGCGAAGGFEIVNEASLKSIEGQVILALSWPAASIGDE